MKCQACGRENREGAGFCDGCGARLITSCPACNAELRAGAKFCDSCGTSVHAPPTGVRAHTPSHLVQKILQDRGRIQGERRSVTVLFADAKGFTPFSEQLDAERVYSITQGCVERMVEAVHRHEGTVNQFTGDGIMAIFGAPIAHEDSARRAVAAALEMQAALSRHLASAGADIGFRVGLNTGPVVVGRINDDLQMDYTAVGDTVNLAARMEQMADPGSVYLTEATQRQVADYFDFDALGPQDVKGKTEPVRVYKAVAARGIKTRLDAAVARGLSPFVGRDRDIEVLKGLWDDALASRGQIVLVSGDPGIGKSRLLLEFRRSLPEDVIWREAHCASYGENIPYLPVVELVRSGFGIGEGDDDGTIIDKVDADTALWSPQAQKTVPYLKFLLQVDPGDATVEQMDPMERRAGILDALRALVFERGKVAPRVVVVEDLHWADDQSEEAFRVVADAVAASPVLMILTFRPGYLHPSADLPNAHRIALKDLDHSARERLAEATLEAASLSTALAAPVTDKAEGNPLFIEEVAKALASGAADVQAVPNSLQDVILARIDRLETTARESLQLASVIGREFTLRLLNRISNLEAELAGVLTELKTLELIYEKAFFPELAYMFKHALTHDVAYSTLLLERRKTLHRFVATAIEELYEDRIVEHYETLAYHYSRAEEWQSALEYLMRSAEKATAAFANRDALQYYERAIEICARSGDHTQAASIMHQRGMLNVSIFAIADALADFARMLTAAEASGDDHLITLALTDRAIAEFFAHEFDASVRSADQALEAANDRFVDVQFQGRMAKGAVYIVNGRLAEGFGAYESAVHSLTSDSEPLLQWLSGEFEVLKSNWRGAYDEAVAAYERWFERLAPQGAVATIPTAWAGSVALGGRGDYERALRVLDEVIATCERTGAFPDMLARSLNTGGWILGEILNHRDAMDWNERALQVAREIPSADPEFENNAILNLADALAATGDLNGAAELYQLVERVVRDPRPQDHWMLWRYAQHLFVSLGELMLAQGDASAALSYADECIELAQNTASTKNEIKGRRLRSRALMAQDEIDEAVEQADAATALAREIGNPPQLWRTLVAAGDLAERSGGNSQHLYREAAAVIERVASSLSDTRRRDEFLASGAAREIDSRLG